MSFLKSIVVWLTLSSAVGWLSFWMARQHGCNRSPNLGLHQTILPAPRALPQGIPLAWARGLRLPAARWQAIARKFIPPLVVRSPGEFIHHVENWHPTGPAGAAPHAQRLLAALLTPGQGTPLEFPKGWLYFDHDRHARIAGAGELGGETHPNQFLASLGRTGVSATRSIETPGVHTTVAELINQAIANRRPDDELEWTSLLACHYLPNGTTWKTRHGGDITFNALAEQLLNAPQTKRLACVGTHRLQALATILAINAQTAVLNQTNRFAIQACLQNAARQLTRNQLPDGSWSPFWDAEFVATTDRILHHMTAARFTAACMQATGHHFEWLRLAPPDCQPALEVIDRALAFLATELEHAKVSDIQEQLCSYSHAFRILRAVHEAVHVAEHQP